MAQKVQVILEDDLDGGDADETVSFALDGVSYEIDLSTANAEKLREALSLYVGSARRIGGRTGGGARQRRSSSGGGAPSSGGGAARSGDTAAIREWARENGHEVSERGRIPSAVREAYEAAHAG
ncbi:histone-like nucleoid-structuring protein Lsr2 [Vallicoccus soli]|uniref:Lsr2 family protein n=1 Tax=Vallicoccus soli TaxID=2339232 RepID=A0A3A3Z611_9ACTN|nr:Lsr2 family protein [Vallicoccus soli]RJK96054.1 Lsr2 family protein [Vallicoccus soli]